MVSMKNHWLKQTTSLCGYGFLALGLFYSGVACANPSGGVVTGGNASIVSSGKKLDVHQHSDQAVIDWRSFDIGVDEHTQFHQPSSGSTALNRVKSADPSRIAGKLSANGHVILVNPNGVVFDRGARVDVNGLIATSADIDTRDFMAGTLNFSQPGDPDASIVNHGEITAKEAGLVGLVAPNVENHGVIRARLGKVQLASGDTFTVDLHGDGLLSVEASDAVTSQLVANTGRISAEGGEIALSAAAGRELVDSLIVVEGELTAPTIKEKGGKIVIAAAGAHDRARWDKKGGQEADPALSSSHREGQETEVGDRQKQGQSTVLVGNAYLDASGRDAGEQGGKIEITGDVIGLLPNTIIDASGHSAPSSQYDGARSGDRASLEPVSLHKQEASAGNRHKKGSASLTADKSVRTEEAFLAHAHRAGGSIKIGGDYLGTGDTPAAQYVYVDPQAFIFNDALHSGDGGRTIIWSDDTTQFYGNVLGRGGVEGGHGGFLETSGKRTLDAYGYADLTAKEGWSKGTYLLDPAAITIYGNVDPTFVSTDTSINLNADLELWLDAADTSQVELTYSTDALAAATASGAVGTNTITTSADVSAQLAVGARIRLGAAGAVTTADTLGTDTYTITAIAGTTLTVQETLTSTYAGDNLFRGLVSQISDKSGNNTNHATQSTESRMPLWVDNKFGSSDSILFDGVDDELSVADHSSLSFVDDTFHMFITANSDNPNQEQGLIRKRDWGYSIWKENAGNDALRFNAWNLGGADTYSFLATSDLDTSNNIYSWKADSIDSDLHTNGGFIVTVGKSGNTAGDGAQPLIIGFGGNAIPDGNWNGTISDIIFFADDLPDAARNLMEQYQSVKWGIALTPPGSGATEFARATASTAKGDATDGYSAFTTRYLERLSDTADILLHADNTITLDLQGDTLDLANNRSITLRTDNQGISTVSNGAIRTSGTGNITFDAGQHVRFKHDFDLTAQGSGDITLKAARSIESDGGGSITTNGGDVILNADTDSSALGGVELANATITTNGGDFVIGGGNSPTTLRVTGDDPSGRHGVFFNNATISTGAGDISILAQARQNVDSNEGIYMLGGTSLTTTTGSITLDGLGRAAAVSNSYGVEIDNSTLTTGSGDITITGRGQGTVDRNYGAYIHNGSSITSQGDIQISGTGANGNDHNYGAVFDNVTVDNRSGGTLQITGTGGNATGVRSYGTVLDDATFRGSGTITGNGGNGAGIDLGLQMLSNNIFSDGNYILNGTGGASGNVSYGIILEYAGLTEAQGNTSLTFNGVGQGCGNHCGGMYLGNGNYTLRAADGDLTFNLSTSSSTSEGVLRINDSSGAIETTGAGNIVINTTNTGAADNEGFMFSNGTSTIRTTGTGDITFNHNAGTSNREALYARIDGVSTNTISAAGDLTFNVDNGFRFDEPVTLSSGGTMTVAPRIAGESLDVGTVAAADVNITDAELANATATTGFAFGSATSGATTFNSAFDFTGGNLTLSGASVDVQSNANAGTNTLTVDAATGAVTTGVNTLTATTLNLDAGTTITADINATNVDINNNATGATLTGLVGGAVSQAAADTIIGGPGNNPNYTFENFVIRKLAGGGGVPLPATPVVEETAPEPSPAEPVVPVVPAPESQPQNPAATENMTIPNTVEIVSQRPLTAAGLQEAGDLAIANVGLPSEQTEQDMAEERELEILNGISDPDNGARRILKGLIAVDPEVVELFALDDKQRF